MPEKSLNVVRALYDAFGKGDIPTALGLMDEAVEWREAESFMYADGNPYIGPQAVLEGVFMRLGTEWDGFTVTPETWLDAGDDIVVLGGYTGAYKATGKSIDSQFAHVWKVKNGKIASYQQLADTKQLAEAAA